MPARSSASSLPQPDRSGPLRAWRASRNEGEGERGGSAAAAGETLAVCPLFPRTKRRSWEVGSFPASTCYSGLPFSCVGQPETGGATSKGLDSVAWGSASKNPAQGSLFFRGNCASLAPFPHSLTPPARAAHPSPPLRFYSSSSLPEREPRVTTRWVSCQPPVPKPRVGLRESCRAAEGEGALGGAKGRGHESGGGLERKPRGREAGKERGGGGWTTPTGRPALRRAIQLPCFSSARPPGFWGPLPPGSPPGLSLASLQALLAKPWDSEEPTPVLGRGRGRKQTLR